MINNLNPLMVNTGSTGGFARWLLLVLLCLGFSDAVKAVAFVGVTSKVPHTGSQFGAHRETVEDFRVKVLGGTVRVTRTWEGEDKQWYINRRWAPLVVEYQIGSCVVSGSNRVFAIGGGGGGGGGAGSVGQRLNLVGCNIPFVCPSKTFLVSSGTSAARNLLPNVCFKSWALRFPKSQETGSLYFFEYDFAAETRSINILKLIIT